MSASCLLILSSHLFWTCVCSQDRLTLFVPHTHTHTTVLLLCWNLSGTTRVSRYQKGKNQEGKTNLDLLEQETVSGSGICWAICKSAPHPRQPRQNPTTQFFTGRMPFLPPNQQRQSTEGEHCLYHYGIITKLPCIFIRQFYDIYFIDTPVSSEFCNTSALIEMPFMWLWADLHGTKKPRSRRSKYGATWRITFNLFDDPSVL